MPVVYVAAPEGGWTPKSFLRDVIDPALGLLAVDETESFASARMLLLGTALQESLLIHVEQMANKDGSRGPALGYFQMEPTTHDDIWANYLKYRKMIAAQTLAIAGYASGTPKAALLKIHPIYAATMARVHYRRKPGSLPAAGDVKAMAAYWKQHYNTVLGKGTVAEFEEKMLKAIKQL